MEEDPIIACISNIIEFIIIKCTKSCFLKNK